MSAQADKSAAAELGRFSNPADVQVPTIFIGSSALATGVSDFSWPVRPSGTPASFSFTTPQAAVRRSVAERFTRLAESVDGVEEVWLDCTMPDLEVSVVMRDVDLERELKLRGAFIDLVCEVLDPSVGQLSVYAKTEAVPDALRRGLQLA
jgi:hypothetical protein